MNCRYCGGVYEAKARTCGGCGAPKSAISTLLDLPATPDHWTNSLGRTTWIVLMLTAGICALATAVRMAGWVDPAMFLLLFWAVPIAPILLFYSAWRSSQGQVGGRLLNLFCALAVAAGVAFVIVIAGGILVGSEGTL